MNFEISVTKTQNSRLSSLDFHNLPFGRTFSDHMFLADYRDGQWHEPRIVPFDYFPMHPASMVLHYGQAIFEGMKASKGIDGKPYLFRPERHANRINLSAERLCMPAFPEDLFVEALHQLVALDQGWIPPIEGSALYIRPFMIATDEFIGVKPSDTYQFIIFTGPVGPYYTKPVRLIAETSYIRAAEGGTGFAKAAGNYAGSLLPAKIAQEKGFDQVLWLDAKEFKYVQEVGTMNLFFVIDGKVLTPNSGGTILDGITRDTIIRILKANNYTIEERPISIDEIEAAHKNGTLQEAFGSGTAAVVSHISEIAYNANLMKLPPMETRTVGEFAKNTINGLRAGTIPDTNNWVIPVKQIPELASV